jgi:hypothetical protein
MAAKTKALSQPVGSIVASMLTEAQFQGVNGTDWVLADGRSVAGTTYAVATGENTVPDLRGQFLRGRVNYSNRTFATTDVNITNENITITNHGITRTGFKVRFTSSGTLPAGLVATETYYVIIVDPNTIRVASTLANAIAGTAINLTSVGTGTHTLTQWEDPDSSARVKSSENGSSGNALGARQDDAMHGHHHTIQYPTSGASGTNTRLSQGTTFIANQTWGDVSPTSDGANGTPRTSSETRPNNILINYFIKVN